MWVTNLLLWQWLNIKRKDCREIFSLGEKPHLIYCRSCEGLLLLCEVRGLMLIRDMPGSTWVVSGSLLVQACSLHQPHKCFHYFWHWWTEFRFRLQLRYNNTHHVSKSWNEVCTNVQQVPAHPIAPSLCTLPHQQHCTDRVSGEYGACCLHIQMPTSINPSTHFHGDIFPATTWTIQIKLHCSTS
jgi:hypothetical protein